MEFSESDRDTAFSRMQPEAVEYWRLNLQTSVCGRKNGEMGGGSSIAGVLSALGCSIRNIEIPEIFRIAASAYVRVRALYFQLYEWLHPGGTRAVSFHRGRTPGNVENRGVYMVALGF